MNCTSAEQRTQTARGTLHRAATIPRPPVHPAAGNPSRPSPRLKQARPAPGAGQQPGGRLDAGCGCARRRRWCAGRDLRPLGEIHLRLRHSSPPAASNRSAPFGAAPTATQAKQVVAQIGGSASGYQRGFGVTASGSPGHDPAHAQPGPYIYASPLAGVTVRFCRGAGASPERRAPWLLTRTSSSGLVLAAASRRVARSTARRRRPGRAGGVP